MPKSPIDKTIKVLEVMEVGLSVEIDGYKYAMADNKIGYVITCSNNCRREQNEWKEILFLEIPLNQFIELCGKLSEDKIPILSAKRSLNDLRRNRYRSS